MFKVLALGWLVLGTVAHAEIIVKSVALAASNELTVVVSDSGQDLTVKLSDVRANGSVVQQAQDPVVVKAQRFDDVVALMLNESDTETAQLELYQPTNGNYKPMLAKPILDGTLAMEQDFAEVMSVGLGHGWKSADVFASMNSYFQKNPAKRLLGFRLEMERLRVARPAAPAPAAPADPGATAPPTAPPVANRPGGMVPPLAPLAPQTPVATPPPPGPGEDSAPARPAPPAKNGGYARPGGWLFNSRG